MEWAVRLTPRRVMRALVLLGVVVYLAVPAVREPVVMWWVNYKTDQLTSRLDPLLTKGRPPTNRAEAGNVNEVRVRVLPPPEGSHIMSGHRLDRATYQPAGRTDPAQPERRAVPLPCTNAR